MIYDTEKRKKKRRKEQNSILEREAKKKREKRWFVRSLSSFSWFCFFRHLDLIWFVLSSILISVSQRLCISSDCVPNILAIAHEQRHSDFEVCFEIISRSWYIKELIRALREYIKHCSQCQQIQIRWHKSWKSLQSIHSSFVSFHTITMNFVLQNLKINKELNCILSVIDKFSKRIMLISEKFTYIAKQWSDQYLKELNKRNWEISKVIISDRDRKFLSDFWRNLFLKLEIFMLYFTVHHSQIDEASERINQTLKIAFRYYIQKFQDSTLWTTALWKFQLVFNNTRFAITDKISNELLYEVTSNMSLNISISDKSLLDLKQLRKKA